MIYNPGEDSFMLAHQVRQHARGIVLDMGTGTGIQAVAAAESKRVKKVYAVDIDKKAIEHCKKIIKDRKIRFFASDLFSAKICCCKFLRMRKKNMGELSEHNTGLSQLPCKFKHDQKSLIFDTIIFNPPYLPAKKIKDLTIEGGRKGYETVARFLEDAGSFLKPDGIMLLVFSSLTNKSKVIGLIEENLFGYKELMATHIFFEDIFVFMLQKNPLLKSLEKKRVRKLRYFMEGKRGIIYKGEYRGKAVAIKTKKPESRAVGRIENEAAVLKIVNRQGIGPKFLFAGKGYMVYEFIDGQFIRDWLCKAKKQAIREALKKVFMQCYKLDALGINKEEMHHPVKHVIIGKKTVLIDFERARRTEHPHNVTQFCQYVLANRQLLNKKGFNIDAPAVICLAREYKGKMTMENLTKIMGVLE